MVGPLLSESEVLFASVSVSVSLIFESVKSPVLVATIV